MNREATHSVEEAVAGLTLLCPWMDAEDVALMREVFRAHMGLVVGEEVDVGLMAGAILVLAQRAEAVGDRRRAWAFGQWYDWACAAMRGEEYHWPDLPPELAALT
jgi:hypothetical protein